MIELIVGSRFWYCDKLCEVREGSCIDCDCVLIGDIRKCNKAKCKPEERHDKKFVYFKEVKNV